MAYETIWKKEEMVKELDKKEKFYAEYCSGCGLCASAEGVVFTEKNGFEYPEKLSEKQIKFCEQICPVNGINYNKRQESELWGPNCGVFKAWSMDKHIRFDAASGGTITGLACFLIETGKCDEVIQMGPSETKPYGIQMFVYSNSQQIKAASSSRYITGITFSKLLQMIERNKKYAVIGKPCDIEALHNFVNYNPELRESIKYTITFFCAGAPSKNATVRLAEYLGVKEGDIKSIRYRGKGWPGKATITLNDNSQKSMEYIDSWNRILGRDIRKMCKFCLNGVGMFADLSCGDLWKLREDYKPNFTEDDGQNVVFARTDVGRRLLQQASEAGYIHMEEYTELDKLKYVQPNHYIMQTTMLGKIIGLRFMERGIIPKYNFKKLMISSRKTPIIKIARTAIGTMKRIINGSI